MGKVYGKCIDDRRAILQVFPLICSVDESEHSDESGTVHEMEAEEERSCCSFAIYTLGELACRVKSSSEYSEVKQPIASAKKLPPSPAPARVSKSLSSLSHCAGVRQCVHSSPRLFLKISLHIYSFAAEIHRAECVKPQNCKSVTMPLDSSSIARRTDNIFRY